MKFIQADGDVVERRPAEALTGLTCVAVVLDSQDLKALLRLSPDDLHDYINSVLLTRFTQ